MTQRRGLGRGLGAFFPVGRQDAAAPGLVELPLDDIAANPNQPRRAFDVAALESLADSIRANGLLSPIIVRPAGGPRGKYEIVAGERRWRAARLAGLSELPAIVRDVADGASIELALLENLQRADLNAIEEAAGYRTLLEEHGFTQDALGQRLGKNRSTITNALRLLSLPDPVQALVRDGALSAGHARALAALSAEQADAFARRIVAQGLSVRDVEHLVADAARARSSGRKSSAPSLPGTSRPLSPDMADVENRLRYALATRVTLNIGARGGSIIVHFADDRELQRLVDHLAPQ
jgi:ParB family transcriptional regulator, chromosome partitioning protein